MARSIHSSSDRGDSYLRISLRSWGTSVRLHNRLRGKLLRDDNSSKLRITRLSSLRDNYRQFGPTAQPLRLEDSVSASDQCRNNRSAVQLCLYGSVNPVSGPSSISQAQRTEIQ